MADITTPNTFAAGTPLDPAPVAENTFGPESLPQNMAALNGRLNRSNLVAPATVTRDMVRSGSFLTGRRTTTQMCGTLTTGGGAGTSS